MGQISRRMVLMGAVAAAAALPALTAPAPEDAVVLARRWLDLNVAGGTGLSDAEVDDIADHQEAILHDLMAVSAEGAAGLYAKLQVLAALIVVDEQTNDGQLLRNLLSDAGRLAAK